MLLSDEMRIARKRRILRRVIFLIFVGTLIVGSLYALGSSYLRVRTVTIVGDRVDPAKVREVVESELAGAYLGLVPRDSLFFYPATVIAARLAALDPDLARVDTQTHFSGELTIEFAFHRREWLWCQSAASNECVVLDEHGAVFATGSPAETLPKIFFSSPPSPETLAIVRGVSAALASSTGVRSATLTDDTIVYATAEGWQLRTNIADSPDDISRRFSAALSSGTLSSPKARQSLEYLDLRFGNRIFYKFK